MGRTEPVNNVFYRPNPMDQTNDKPGAGKAVTDFIQAFATGGLALAQQMLPALGAAGLNGGALGLSGTGSGLMNSLMSGGKLSQEQLLMLQEELQRQSQMFQTMSNISKTDHDTKMNTIRSIKP